MEAQRDIAGYICGYVGGNEVGEKGCRHLSKAAWEELEMINLCHCSLTQGKTKSEILVADRSVGEPGRKCNNFTWVFIKIFQGIVA